MQTAKESVDLYLRFSADGLEPHRAESRHNFSFCLSQLGRREEALQVIQEAVCCSRRSLVAAQPGTFAPDLADSLFQAFNLSVRFRSSRRSPGSNPGGGRTSSTSSS